MLRRRSKRLELSKGVNRVEENKRIIPLEELRDNQITKRQKSEEQLKIVQARQISNFTSNIQKKTYELQRHERLLFMKSFEAYLRQNLDVFLKIRNFWKICVIFAIFANFIREKIKFNRKKRFLTAYMRQLRNAAVLTGLKKIRKTGENPIARVLFDTKMLTLYKMTFQLKQLRRRSRKICVEVLHNACTSNKKNL